MKLLHKADFSVEITSYENDGDYKATNFIYADSKEKLTNVLHFLKSIDEYCNNLYDPHESTIKKVANKVFEDPNCRLLAVSYYGKGVQYDADTLADLLYDIKMIGQEENQYSRSINSVAIYFYKEDGYVEDFTKLWDDL